MKKNIHELLRFRRISRIIIDLIPPLKGVRGMLYLKIYYNPKLMERLIHLIPKELKFNSPECNSGKSHMHPSTPLADLIKDIKLASSDMIKKKNLFPGFNKWQIGYGAFTYSFDEKYLV